MAPDAEAFVRSLWAENRVLAARCAAQPEVLPAVPATLVGELASGLLERIESTESDLRHRMACSHVLPELGDPRFERHKGPHGQFLMPPLARIEAGQYVVGDDEPIEFSFTGASGETAAHVPRHPVQLDAFQISRFPITNAEWSCFMAADGYEDERWWQPPFGRSWQEGELANEGAKANNRLWRRRFLEDPELLEQMATEGRFASDAAVERWRKWMQMDEEEFEEALASQWTADRKTAPRFWKDVRFNEASQPVVGVCWYEARAYCAWLSAQSGMTVRLPTEVEWEAAARGRSARRYAYGDSFDALAANTVEAHVKQPSPVGVFPNGQTPEGVHDLSGNVAEWTSSLFGAGELDDEVPEFGYPYDPTDGREDLDADPRVRRVGRGGAWNAPEPSARSTFRHANLATARLNNHGFRVVVEG